MKMGLKVFYSEISGSKEVKKRQQRVMMILESKTIPYEAIDITEAGKEDDKDYMLKNAKPKGDATMISSPQIFNDDVYCGDYDDFDLANENDVLEDFLKCPKVERKFSIDRNAMNQNNHNGGQVVTSTTSREGSAEAEQVIAEKTNGSSTETENPPSTFPDDVPETIEEEEGIVESDLPDTTNQEDQEQEVDEEEAEEK